MYPTAQTPLTSLYTPLTRKQSLPLYARAAKPPGMRLTNRDIAILSALYEFESGLADYQIKHLFFTGVSQTHLRLKLLYHNGLIERLERRHRAYLPAMLFWLTQQGIETLKEHGYVPTSKKPRPRLPKWSQIFHDIALNDVRIAVILACRTTPSIGLSTWRASWEFWRDFDTVSFQHEQKGQPTTHKRGVRADGYVAIEQIGKHPARFLIEFDNGTEAHNRLIRDKYLAGVAYLKTSAYKKRFGYNAGTWLYITTSDKRRQHMQERAKRVLKRDVQYLAFTTFDKIVTFPEDISERARRYEAIYHDILNAPIWYRGATKHPSALLSRGV